MTEKELQDRLAQAAVRVKAMDEIDRTGGFAAPVDSGTKGVIRTVVTALGAAARTEDWDIVCDAIVMCRLAVDCPEA